MSKHLTRATLTVAFTFSVLTVGATASGAADKAAPDKAPAAAKAAPAKAEKKEEAAAAKTKTEGGETTLKGDMTCAKCGLHEAKECQNVLMVKDAKGGKETKYYLTKNPVADDHHKQVCKGSTPATVTGKVSDEGGKKMIAASAVTYN